jgi:hypothetical protein
MENEMIKRREVPIFIILSIVTCGIYTIIWMFGVIKDTNKMYAAFGEQTEIEHPLIPALIGSIYWMYYNGNKMKRVGEKRGIMIAEDGAKYLLFILLGFVTCSITYYIIMAKFIGNFNALAESYNNSLPA